MGAHFILLRKVDMEEESIDSEKLETYQQITMYVPPWDADSN